TNDARVCALLPGKALTKGGTRAERRAGLMSSKPLTPILSHVRQLAGARPAGPTDVELLARFVAGRDGAAFAELVRRHGPMVVGLCRRVLRQEQDAEDAFQATFLTLARKAHTVSQGAALGGWLYAVAWRQAARARARAASRRLHEGRAAS